jgi:DNA-directed RNA polymerase subunit beta'
MMSTNNILSPANGDPIIVPSQDVVLGIYFMTRDRINAKGEGMVFANVAEVQRAYGAKHVDLQAIVKVRVVEYIKSEDGSMEAFNTVTQTTVGRALLSEIMPQGMPYSLINKTMKKKDISTVINACYRNVGLKETVIFADQLMYTGFAYATRSGASVGVNDFVIPDKKASIINGAEDEVREIESQFRDGLVTQGEKYNKVIDIWSRANELVAGAMMDSLKSDTVINAAGEEVEQESFNSVYMMADSGARGSAAQMRQ